MRLVPFAVVAAAFVVVTDVSSFLPLSVEAPYNFALSPLRN